MWRKTSTHSPAHSLSRSLTFLIAHSLIHPLTVTIEMTEKYDDMAAAAVGKGKDDSHIRVGKLNLVDLAGSERQSKTGATGARMCESVSGCALRVGVGMFLATQGRV